MTTKTYTAYALVDAKNYPLAFPICVACANDIAEQDDSVDIANIFCAEHNKRELCDMCARMITPHVEHGDFKGNRWAFTSSLIDAIVGKGDQYA